MMFRPELNETGEFYFPTQDFIREHDPLQFYVEEQMAKVGEMIESKYLKQSDVDGEALVTVQAVAKRNIAREGDDPEYKWLAKFKEFQKPLVLNSTNIKRLARALGDDTDDWIGKQVVLYVDPDIEFGGNVTGGLRIREAKKKKVASITDDANEGSLDDIPF